MNEPENILATIESLENKITLDLELPATLPVSELKIKILEVLKNFYAELFMNWEKFFLIYENKILSDNETLISSGIYDGSYVYIIKSEE